VTTLVLLLVTVARDQAGLVIPGQGCRAIRIELLAQRRCIGQGVPQESVRKPALSALWSKAF